MLKRVKNQIEEFKDDGKLSSIFQLFLSYMLLLQSSISILKVYIFCARVIHENSIVEMGSVHNIKLKHSRNEKEKGKTITTMRKKKEENLTEPKISKIGKV